MLRSFTQCYIVLQSVTQCFTVLNCFTECYTILHGVTRCFSVLHGVKGCYKKNFLNFSCKMNLHNLISHQPLLFCCFCSKFSINTFEKEKCIILQSKSCLQ